jgi:diguanylate cyclase (GGDEF)-like protein
MRTINDECGHHEGDNALIDVAHILKNTFRESDIIARIGGDEFAILLLDPASPEIDDVIINNVHSTVRKFNELRNRNYTLCLSIGVANYNPAKPCSIDELITQADILMYEDKKQKCDKDMLKAPQDILHEKRSFQRYKTGDDYWATLDGSERIRIKDVSLGGICLKTSHHFTADTLHEVNIISTDNEEIISSGKVVRSFLIDSKSDQDKYSAYFETALKFDEKNYSFIETLELFISRFAS